MSAIRYLYYLLYESARPTRIQKLLVRLISELKYQLQLLKKTIRCRIFYR